MAQPQAESPAAAAQVWDDDSDEPAAACRSACQSMFQGAWRLLLRRPRPLSAAELAGELLEPVKPTGKQDNDKPDPIGTMPHRAMQLKPAAFDRDLYVRYSWIGSAKLSGFCCLVKDNGKLIDTFWDGKPGSLRQNGVQVIPASRYVADAADLGAFALRLGQLPESAYSILFFLVAHETSLEETGSGFESVREAEVCLSTGLGEPHIWRWKQWAPEETANTWLCAMLYRGSFGRWRLEPLSMKFLVVALQDSCTDWGIAEAARNLTWRNKWLAKDRCWAAVEAERGMGRLADGGA